MQKWRLKQEVGSAEVFRLLEELLPDLDGRKLGSLSLFESKLVESDLIEQPEGDPFAEQSAAYAAFQSDAPACDKCGMICVRAGNCYICHACGNSQGCS